MQAVKLNPDILLEIVFFVCQQINRIFAGWWVTYELDLLLRNDRVLPVFEISIESFLLGSREVFL